MTKIKEYRFNPKEVQHYNPVTDVFSLGSPIKIHTSTTYFIKIGMNNGNELLIRCGSECEMDKIIKKLDKIKKLK